jgi:hypothetical protein
MSRKLQLDFQKDEQLDEYFKAVMVEIDVGHAHEGGQ